MNPPIRLYMSMSLDGFIAGPDDRQGQELGRDGGRLFNWMDDRMSDGPSGQVFRELKATGAPIFVLTHRADDGGIPPGATHLRYRIRHRREHPTKTLKEES